MLGKPDDRFQLFKNRNVMKTRLFLIPILAFGLTALPAEAQEAAATDTIISGSDTIVVRSVGFASDNRNSVRNCPVDDFGGSYNSSGNVPKRWKWHGGHWAGIGIYYNGLVENLGNLSLPDGAGYLRQTPKSIGVNVNFADLVLVSNRHFGLITGIGLEMNNFRFDKNISLTQDIDGNIIPDYSYDEAGIELRKSKLTTVYLNIPLLVEFQFGRSRNGQRAPGFVNFGVVGGVRLQGHTKVKYRDDGMHTRKQHEGLNLRNFHCGVECNVGYKWVALSARYYPQSIFISGKGPDVQQVNIGLSFMF